MRGTTISCVVRVAPFSGAFAVYYTPSLLPNISEFLAKQQQEEALARTPLEEEQEETVAPAAPTTSATSMTTSPHRLVFPEP
jgi:hypothetical protein